MKRILAYSMFYRPEVAATAQIYTDLFEGLGDEFDITVICAVPCYTGEISDEYKEKHPYYEEYNNVHVIRVPVREWSKQDKISRYLNLADFWFQARRVTKTLNETFDLIFTYSHPPILGGMLGVWASKRFKVPLVYGIQDFNPEQAMAVNYAGGSAIHKIMMALDCRSCRASSAVVVPGRDLRDTLYSRLNNKNIPECVVINNWADDRSVTPLPKNNPGVSAFRRQWGLENKFVVMYSGNIGLYYDLENIIKVIAKFKDHTDIAFVFIGDGAVKSILEDLVRSENLANVIFIPYQEKSNLIWSLNAADVHLVTNAPGIKGVSCPSKAYGIMATNVPIIGILEPGSEVWRIIEESHCGELVETGNYEEIYQLLTCVLSEKEDFINGHETGRNYLDQHLTKDKAIEKYRELFSRL